MFAHATKTADVLSPATPGPESQNSVRISPTRLDDHPLLDMPEYAVFYICDRDGEITHSNGAFMELAAEVGASADYGVAPAPFPMGAEALKAIMRRIEDWRMPVIREEPFILGGELRRFRSIHLGLYGEDNRLIGVAGVYQNAESETGQRSAFARLRERFDDIAQLSSDWIWETDPWFQLTYLSPRVTDALGFLPRELEGKNLLELGIFEPDHGRQVFDWSSPFRDTPFQICDRDQRSRRFLLSGMPYYCSNTGAFLGLRGTAREEAVECQKGSTRRAPEPVDPGAPAPRDFALEQDLRHAVERDQMHLCYHPLVDLMTGRVTGVEALIRWVHPERGALSPDLFIPIAEATGAINPIGDWVLHTACRQARLWQDAGLPAVRVGINLSPAQFHRDDLVDTVRWALRETGLDPRWLELEITEGMVMDDTDAVTDTLGALRALGVDLAIDDFGTGYSSLAYLQRFPVTRLKIDRGFVDDICANDGNAAITRAIITLAHDLDLKVIAEGVENQAQFDHLSREGCDEAQGFHFTRPLTGGDMTDWLSARRFFPRESNRRRSRVGARDGQRRQELSPSGMDSSWASVLPESA